MAMHPQAQALLEMMKHSPVPAPGTVDAATYRAILKQVMPPTAQPEAVAQVQNRTIPGPGGDLPVRIYTPKGTGPFPLLMFFHGGGFVVCDLDSHDNMCRALCNEASTVVVSVDYRLAPEHPYPAAPQDCYAATCWAAQHAASLQADPQRLAVAGDSAGGCLAAVVALMARDQGGPAIAHQSLIYAVTNHANDYHTPGERGSLDQDAMRWYWAQYLSDPAQGQDAYVSPLRARSLANLPPAAIVTAGYDPLCAEGQAYAQALQAAGNRVQHRCYEGQFHGFASMLGMLDDAREALVWLARDMQSTWTGSPPTA